MKIFIQFILYIYIKSFRENISKNNYKISNELFSFNFNINLNIFDLFTDAHDSGFSIQGATDGSAQIQGSSDGHSNFQIQGATQGIAERYVQGPSAGAYNIQGASDGHSQSIIQGAYDGRSGAPKSLQYNDPSGERIYNFSSLSFSRLILQKLLKLDN